LVAACGKNAAWEGAKKVIDKRLKKLIKEEIQNVLKEETSPDLERKLKNLFNDADNHPGARDSSSYEKDYMSWVLGYQQAIKDALEEVTGDLF